MRRWQRPILLATTLVAVIVVVAVVVGAGPRVSFRPEATPAPSTGPSANVPPAALQVDGLATVVAEDGLWVWEHPEHPELSPLPGMVPPGTTVYLTAGPEVAAGQTWWQMQPAHGRVPMPPFGWIRALDEAGEPNLSPSAPVCPPADQVMNAATLRDMGGLVALACYGDTMLTIEGMMTCTTLVGDGGAAGPSWLDPYSGCSMDEALAVSGPPVAATLEGGLQPPNPRTGRYRVQGHFDDAEARTCSWVPVGVSVTTPLGPPDPGAVIVCRQLFVATDAERLPDP